MSSQPAETISRQTTAIPTCYHCHEECRDGVVPFDEKDFCCQGCKMVYEILNANDLCNYYQLDANPGISLRGRRQEQYAYLDDAEVVEKLVAFTDGERTRVTFYLPQIHCASCVWLLENLYRLNEGITQSKVNFLKKEISLTYLDGKTTLRKIVELLASIGYAPAINLGNLDPEPRRPVSRTFYFQIGVAGFAFGNIMLLSFPEYLGLDSSDRFFQSVFGYLNILLSLPVVLYSARDYFRSAWGSLRQGYLNLDVPIALGIVALFGRSAYEILTHTGAGYVDSLAGLIFFLLTGKWFQQTTYYHLSFERDYKSYFPIAASVRRDGTEQTVPLDKLQTGDIVVLRHGELIPADGILLRGNARIDYSFVTGEAEPVARASGDKLYAGGRQMGEVIELSLTRKVSQSYLTQLWNDEAFQQNDASRTTRLADVIGKRFTLVVMVVSLGALAYWWPRDPGIAFNAFTAVLIIACPCAVALSIPFTLGNALRLLGRQGFYLKNTDTLEDLGRYTATVFDKTGTLTNALQNRVLTVGTPPTQQVCRRIRALASQSNHPVSRQLADHLQDGSLTLPVNDFEELTGQGISGTVEGHRLRLGSASYVLGQADSNSGQVWVEIDGVVTVSYQIQNHFRKGLDATMAFFRKESRTYLLSGDNERERQRLLPLFPEVDAMHFNQSPQAKLEFVKELQRTGGKVLMVGDGLNDAGALRSSDVGIVVTENTNNFTPACDAILRADQFDRLPDFIHYARGSVRLVHYAYFLAFCYNLVGLSYAVSGTLSPVVAAILMPASSITIVLFGVGASTLLARRRRIF
jgi:Cu+-exporting ATPase